MHKLRAATDTLKELALLYSLLLLGCTILFMLLEHHDFPTSLYWAGTTATTTGYGDVAPKSIGGQMLAFVLMHLSVFCVAPLIVVRLIDRMNENRDAFTHEEQVLILEGLARIEAELARQRGEPPQKPA
ncbi:MAG: voltage-gated potassium channel [Sphingomonadales bacterium]|jgi:voltage-gated potassium channel|nr:voltage-gated potassium channel [Sphingomonadales bacterium]